jgi:hypothetical protein
MQLAKSKKHLISFTVTAVSENIIPINLNIITYSNWPNTPAHASDLNKQSTHSYQNNYTLEVM